MDSTQKRLALGLVQAQRARGTRRIGVSTAGEEQRLLLPPPRANVGEALASTEARRHG